VNAAPTRWARWIREPVAVPGYRWDPLLVTHLELPPIGKQRAQHTLQVQEGKRTRAARGSDRVSQTRSHTYTPNKTASWTDTAALLLRTRAAAAGYRVPDRHSPLSVDIVAVFPRVKIPIHPLLHVVKPDRDNVDKLVLDAMRRAGLLVDDDQVAAGGLVKIYASAAEQPGLLIAVHVLVPGNAPAPAAHPSFRPALES